MGMDISGINPQTTGTEPVFPSNWDELSDKAKAFYLEIKDNWDEANPGVYFRANIWSWRPIHLAIVQANISLELGIDDDTIEGMGHNSGDGLKTQKECNALAHALEILADGMDEDKVTEFGFAFGYWNYRDGAMIVSEEDTEVLNKKYPYGKCITEMPLKLATGKTTKDVWPAHVTQVKHLREFIEFLRHCGGFEIW
jgi:hypothetical protein|tara:strand:+ start:3261 stop:3851 length:591 start_codon:yes stop_codon:yes gene_type:complete